MKAILVYQVFLILLVAANLGLAILLARAQYQTAAHIDRLAASVAQLQYENALLAQKTGLLREVVVSQSQARLPSLQDLLSQEVPGTEPLTEEQRQRLQEQRTFWEWLLQPDPSD